MQIRWTDLRGVVDRFEGCGDSLEGAMGQIRGARCRLDGQI